MAAVGFPGAPAPSPKLTSNQGRSFPWDERKRNPGAAVVSSMADFGRAVAKPAATVLGTAGAGAAGALLYVGTRAFLRWWGRRAAERAGAGSMDDALKHARTKLRRNNPDIHDIIMEANHGLDRSDTYTERIALPDATVDEVGRASQGGSDTASIASRCAALGLREPQSAAGCATYVEKVNTYLPNTRIVSRGIWSDAVAECKAQLGLLSHTPAHHQAVVAFLNRWLRDTFPDLRKADIAKNVPRCVLAYFIRTDDELSVEEMFEAMKQMGRVRTSSTF